MHTAHQVNCGIWRFPDFSGMGVPTTAGLGLGWGGSCLYRSFFFAMIPFYARKIHAKTEGTEKGQVVEKAL